MSHVSVAVRLQTAQQAIQNNKNTKHDSFRLDIEMDRVETTLKELARSSVLCENCFDSWNDQ